MKSIILAAGFGHRLQDVLKGKPKPLFELKGKSLLEYSVESLSARGVKEIIIAVGFNGEQIKQKIGHGFNGMQISYAENEIYDKSESMHSLFSSLKEPEGCLVLEGDLIYDPVAISELINHEKENLVLLSKVLSKKGDEVYVTLNENGQIMSIGKNLANLDSRNPLEFVGISKFSKNFMKKMFEIHKDNLINGRFEGYYEDCATKAGSFIPLYGFNKKNFQWAEVDRKEDIERAERVLYGLSKIYKGRYLK